MAYLRSLKRPCEAAGCKKTATVQVVDRWNGTRGAYCTAHGRFYLKRQQAAEDPSPIR